jgi:hypothetical protein
MLSSSDPQPLRLWSCRARGILNRPDLPGRSLQAEPSFCECSTHVNGPVTPELWCDAQSPTERLPRVRRPLITYSVAPHAVISPLPRAFITGGRASWRSVSGYRPSSCVQRCA